MGHTEVIPVLTRSIRQHASELGHVADPAVAALRRVAGTTDRSLVVVGAVGLVAVAVGVGAMQQGPVAFTPAGVLDGITSQLGTTLPAALTVFAATVLNLGAGAVLVRLLRAAPYPSIAGLVLAGLAGAVLLDTTLLFALGPIGLFKPLLLALVNLGILAASPFVRPWLVPGERRPAGFGLFGWLLVVVVWSAPILLQLASPVVPFLDVLPNHVAPVQHLQTYGTWESLAVDPSPIYGPSRLFLGYVGLLGTLSVLTGTSAGLTVAAFALPLAILVGTGAALLAGTLTAPGSRWHRALGEPDRSSATGWVLLTVPLTFVFLRTSDARDSVLVFPLVCLAIAVFVDAEGWRGRSRPVLVAASVAAAFMVHPLGGAFLGATILTLAMLQLSLESVLLAIASLAGAAIVALPQVAVMVGLSPPAWAALPCLPIGLAATAWLAGGRTRGVDEPRPPAPDLAWPILVVGVVALVAVVLGAVVGFGPARSAEAVQGAATTSLVDYGVLLVPLAVAALLVRSADAWKVTVAALGVGAVALIVSSGWPGASLFDQSIRYEVPKSVGYWLPWFVAVAGGLGLAAVWDRRDWFPLLRNAVLAAFVVLAAVDFAPGAVEAVGIEQHRYADSLAIALHGAQAGYWVGYPDPRSIVNARERELLDAVRAQQASGAMRPGSTVLHVAPSFQQWAATPLGVFAGVIETDATLDPETSVHTVGGRLRDVRDLPELLRQGFDYVVVEGSGTASTSVDQAVQAGYTPIWQGDSAVLLAR